MKAPVSSEAASRVARLEPSGPYICMLLNIARHDRIKTAEGLERIAKLEKTARKSRKPS